MKIVTVLKTGGDFDVDYVGSIANRVPAEYEFVCLSDDDRVPGYIPFQYNYPTWWSKMEMFRPDIIDDDIFYVDLDTVVRNDITEELKSIEQLDSLTMLSDFYKPENPASGVMFVPNSIRQYIWNQWLTNTPSNIIATMRGDQDFIGSLFSDVQRFDEVIDKEWICSYKAHIKKSHPKHIRPANIDYKKSKIVCFHGKPRPRDISDGDMNAIFND